MYPVSTPLPRRLAETDNVADTPVNTLEFFTPLQRVSSNNYAEWGMSRPTTSKAFSTNDHKITTAAAPTQISGLSGPLEPLPTLNLHSRFAFEKHKVDPANTQAQAGPSQPLYYRPPVSSDNLFGVNHLIPPRISRNFLVRQSEPPVLPKVDEEVDNAPSGEWTSSVVKEALRRQVNTEREVRRLGANILYIAAFKLFVQIGLYFIALYQAEFQAPSFQSSSQAPFSFYKKQYSPASALYANYLINAVYALFVGNIAVALYRLLRSQDQCLDLPLTNEQRRLCGLKPLESNEDDTALKMKKRRFELTHQGTTTQVPKYGQTYGPMLVPDTSADIVAQTIPQSPRIFRSELPQNRLQLRLRLEPEPRQFLHLRSKPALNNSISGPDRQEAERKFNSRFNIDFL